MSDYEELLRASLSGPTEAYKVANSDLNEVVVAVSSALQKVTGLPVKLELRRRSEEVEGTVYNLTLAGGKNPDSLVTFIVPAKGYPIRVGATMTARGELVTPRVLADKEALESYFAELSTNPDSALVVRMSFLLRTRQKQADPS
jgi:hypothetical protein